MSEEEKSELSARLLAEGKTIHEYVGSILTAHERWDLVEWERVPDPRLPEAPDIPSLPPPTSRRPTLSYGRASSIASLDKRGGGRQSSVSLCGRRLASSRSPRRCARGARG
jgi:hypothetical protein